MFTREAIDHSSCSSTPSSRAQDASVSRNDRSYSALMATQPWEEALMLPGKPSGFI